MENERDDYRKIAERRVRLGLLLSDIGQKNGVEVSQQEMQQLIMQAAQQYRPEDRQRFVEYIRQEPMAAAQLRAPLYEDKVVDFLFSKAEISDRSVTREELEAAIEADDTHVHGPGCGHDHHDHDHAEQPKKDAKKAMVKDEGEAKPAKKAGAKKAKAADAAAEEPAPAEAGDTAEAAPKKPRKKKADAE
jgi:trigger factor